MRVIAQGTVYRNPYPNHWAEVVSASTLSWSRVDDEARFLLCAFRSGDAKMSPNGRIRLRGSRDLGESWFDVPSPFADLPGVQPSQAGPHLAMSVEGTTLLMATRMWIVAPGADGWDDDAAGVVHADWVRSRAEAGAEWGAAETADFRRHPDEWAIPCGVPVSLGGGEWIFPMERHARTYVPDWLRRYQAFSVTSHDDGRTWGDPTPTLNDPDERVAYYDQRILAVPDGRLLTMAWVHDVVNDVTLTARAGYSEDGGRTWGQPFDTGIQGGPLNPLVLSDGRIITFFARRTIPGGIRAAMSSDGGATWALDDEFVIWDEATRSVLGRHAPDQVRDPGDPSLWGTMWGWTFGTPSVVEAPDGSVIVTFFAAGFDGVTEIRWVQIEV